jgi:hypothetical protein
MAAGGARLGVRRQRARLASLVLSIGARALGRESWLARAETTGVKAWAVGRRRRACVRAVGYGGDAVGGLAQVGFAQPVSVWRVAT